MAEKETGISVTEKEFPEKVLQKSRKIPVLVDFYADWCGPCQALGPVLEKLAHEYKGKFILAKANVEQAEITASTYDIRSIPNVKLFKGGRPVAEFIGVQAEAAIKRMLDENLGR